MQMEELFRIALGLESPWSTCCSTSWTSAPPLQPDDLPTQNSEEACGNGLQPSGKVANARRVHCSGV